MKTDDYKQELRLSATLHARNAKKNIFAFKKTSADRLRSIADSSRVAAEDRKITDTPNCAKKAAPSLEGPLESDDDISLVGVV